MEFRVFETFKGDHHDTVIVEVMVFHPRSLRYAFVYYDEADSVAKGQMDFEPRIEQWMDREAILFLERWSSGNFGFSTIFTGGRTQFTIDDRYNKTWLPETDEKGVFYLASPNDYYKGIATPRISLERFKVVIEEVLSGG